MASLTASSYDNYFINAVSSGSAPLYQRKATNVLGATLADAVRIGTLTTDKTQLNAVGQVSQVNGTNFYQFTLDGDSLKLSLTSNDSMLRVQILNSSGTIVADSSGVASESLQEAYASATTSSGLDLEAGDYFAKVTFDAGMSRAVAKPYFLSLYSGTVFSESYQTTAASQTSTKQVATVDNTMVFSTSDALAFSVDNIHLANETATTGLTIGWLYENKAALSVTSQLTQTVKDQYYSFTLQKGDNLKMAFNNHTGTSEARIQLYDMTGTSLLADSHGTAKQKEAYAAFKSSDGLSAKNGQYVLKISYAEGENKTKAQTYDFKLYSGTHYTALYKTTAATETAGAALASGHMKLDYTPLTSIAAYLTAEANGEEMNILDTLKELA